MSPSSTGTIKQLSCPGEKPQMSHPATNTQKGIWCCLSGSLPSHTFSLLGFSGLEEPGGPCTFKKWETNCRKNHCICIPGHLLHTMRADDIVTTSKVSCLVGAHARMKSSKALHHHLTQGRTWIVPRVGRKNGSGTIAWEKQWDLIEGMPLAGGTSKRVLSFQSTWEEHYF